MTNLVFQCYQSQKLYGKEPEALEATNAMFHAVLAEYPIEKIQNAMFFYLKKISNEMPTPYDIATIIERGGKPPFDKAVYVSICKKHADERSESEWEYKREYEAFMIEGL